VILLFGGNGQVGRELTRAAVARATPLVSLAHAEADIADRTAVAAAIARHKPALVVNTAAFTKVDLAETEIEAAQRANEAGPAILAAACARAGVPLIHLSTDYVFDGEKTGAYVEGDAISPINNYGRSKAAGEQAVRKAAARHVILRTSWVYGEFGHNFLKTVVRLAATKDELRMVGDQRGCPTATPDIADAILHIAPQLSGGAGAWGTYHLAGTGVTTWHGFAARIVAAQAPLTGRAPRVSAIAARDFPAAARRPENSELDSSLFERVFGFRARPWTEQTDAITRIVVRENLGAQPHVA